MVHSAIATAPGACKRGLSAKQQVVLRGGQRSYQLPIRGIMACITPSACTNPSESQAACSGQFLSSSFYLQLPLRRAADGLGPQ